MKKVGKPSDLYTSRDRTAHVNINGEPNLEAWVGRCVPHLSHGDAISVKK